MKIGDKIRVCDNSWSRSIHISNATGAITGVSDDGRFIVDLSGMKYRISTCDLVPLEWDRRLDDEFKPNDTIKVLSGEFTDKLYISGKTGKVQQRDTVDGYYLIDVDNRWYTVSSELMQLVSRPEDDKPFWESAVAFLYSERERHLEDIDAIDRKIQLIKEYHGIDIMSIMAADFLDEEMIKRRVKHP